MSSQSITDFKNQVHNYEHVMTSDYNIPLGHLSQTVLLTMDALQEFITKNSGADALRIYFAKSSEPKATEDYKFLLVPCFATSNAGEYEDGSDADKIVITPCCKQPPGCGLTGANLL